ncbi:hypothetical protein [Microbacterium sp.]|uniref:hypothetical protein n=1 Tax=Microbacterium sp. TaxID=51671 RepID=UPI003C14DCAF
MDERAPRRMAGARIDLEMSFAAILRLGELMPAAVQEERFPPAAIGETNNAIRSIKGALDKIANELYFDANGSRSRSTYFPIRATPEAFATAVQKQLPNVSAATIDYFESVQP